MTIYLFVNRQFNIIIIYGHAIFLFVSFLCFYDCCRFGCGAVLGGVVFVVLHLIFPHNICVNVFRRLDDLTSHDMSSLL